MNLLIVSGCVSRNKGGIANTMYYLTREFANTDNVTLLGTNYDSPIPNVQVLIKGEKYNHLLAKAKIFVTIMKNNFFYIEEVLCASWTEALFIYLYRRKFKCGYYIMVHGNELLGDCAEKGVLKKIKYKLRDRVINNAKKIFANSTFTKELCNTKWPKTTCVVINPPIDVDIKIPIVEKNPFTLVTVSRLDDRKGIQYVIEAVSNLLKRFPDIKYNILGDGFYKDNLAQLIEKYNLKNHVELWGAVEESVKYSEICRSTVFVMPSFKKNNSVEGFGVSFLEANLMGVPVIGTNSGGIADAIINGVTGCIIEENNIKQLEDTIEGILKGEIIFRRDDCISWAKEHSSKSVAQKYRRELLDV